MEQGLVILAVVLAVFVGGVLVYLVGSFAHLSRHSPRRSVLRALGSAIWEGFWVLLVQPLLPLYFFVGRRMGGRAGGTPVVLVHGYMQNRVDFLRMARYLRRAGAGPLYAVNYAWWRSLESNTETLHRFVSNVLKETDASQVDMVCHSMGGVIAVQYLAGEGQRTIRRCVTIASPHNGVAWRGPVIGRGGRQLRSNSDFFRQRGDRNLTAPVLSISSSHDNIAHPTGTSTLEPKGGRDHVIDHAGHLTIMFHPKVLALVAKHLELHEGQAPTRQKSGG